MLMGTGNLTELTDSDSSGVNMILMGLVSELSINAVLVVQVSNHCKNSIKETDAARKIMHFSKINQRLPFRVDNSLMSMAERKPNRKSRKEIKEIRSMVKDKNFRILLGDKGIDVFNSKMHATGVDPYDFFSKMNVEMMQAMLFIWELSLQGHKLLANWERIMIKIMKFGGGLLLKRIKKICCKDQN